MVQKTFAFFLALLCFFSARLDPRLYSRIGTIGRFDPSSFRHMGMPKTHSRCSLGGMRGASSDGRHNKKSLQGDRRYFNSNYLGRNRLSRLVCLWRFLILGISKRRLKAFLPDKKENTEYRRKIKHYI